MKNFELCYEMQFGRFYFDEDNKKSVHAGIDKTRKIIERSTLKKDIEDIRIELGRIGIKYSEENQKYEIVEK